MEAFSRVCGSRGSNRGTGAHRCRQVFSAVRGTARYSPSDPRTSRRPRGAAGHFPSQHSYDSRLNPRCYSQRGTTSTIWTTTTTTSEEVCCRNRAGLYNPPGPTWTSRSAACGSRSRSSILQRHPLPSPGNVPLIPSLTLRGPRGRKGFCKRTASGARTPGRPSAPTSDSRSTGEHLTFFFPRRSESVRILTLKMRSSYSLGRIPHTRKTRDQQKCTHVMHMSGSKNGERRDGKSERRGSLHWTRTHQCRKKPEPQSPVHSAP